MGHTLIVDVDRRLCRHIREQPSKTRLFLRLLVRSLRSWKVFIITFTEN